MNTVESLTKEQIRQLTSDEFKNRIQQLHDEFSRINSEHLVPLALAIKLMRENCLHRNSEDRVTARFCHDCGEYYKVDTSFSPEVERWFSEQNKITHTKENRPQSLYSLPLAGHMFNNLHHRGIETIPQLLALDPCDRVFINHDGLRVYATVSLIDLEYTETDGPFLSKEKFADFMRNLNGYILLAKFQAKGKLSLTFRKWFNSCIEGRVYNADNRKRRMSVQPFPLD